MTEAPSAPNPWTHLEVRRGLLFTLGLLVAVLGAAWVVCARMPGTSASGAPPPQTATERAIEADLARWIEGLAGEIGARSATPGRGDALVDAAEWLERELDHMGYVPRREEYTAGALRVRNLVVEIPGRDPSAPLVLVGAHYDTYPGSSGANDNASGVAALLALAKRFHGTAPRRTLRFVLFTNEEPPHFGKASMGSRVYAEDCRARDDRIHAMWSLETLGYYTDAPGSQSYPTPLLGLVYPRRGNFVAFVGDLGSRALVRETIGRFREVSRVPSEGAALPGWVAGVGWSDHRSFAAVGYPALMVTDTALFRDPAYHTPGDVPGRLDLDVLSRVVRALGDVLCDLSG